MSYDEKNATKIFELQRLKSECQIRSIRKDNFLSSLKNLEDEVTSFINNHASSEEVKEKLVFRYENPNPKKIQPKVINLSTKHLTTSQISLLPKGQKFCPTTKGNILHIDSDIKQFTRKLILKEKFHGTENTDISIIKKKSNYNIKTTLPYLDETISKIEQIKPIKIQSNDNITQQERIALKDLKEMKNIVIKKADQENTFIVINSTYYNEKLVHQDHLLSANTYKRTKSESNKIVFRDLIKMIEKYNFLTKNEINYITNFKWKSSSFYITPKIHKCQEIIDKVNASNSLYIEMKPPNDFKGRPIIAGINSPTSHLSQFLHIILSPIVTKQKTFIKDDWDFLRKISRALNSDSCILTCDIVNLYTSIPHNLGLEALKYWIKKHKSLIGKRFTPEFIIESTYFILKHLPKHLVVRQRPNVSANYWNSHGYEFRSRLCMPNNWIFRRNKTFS
ncbi:uncharacterized protein LOC136093777 [Hydra vulgaris]|uniref:uncharacterized protein LOC136093777 n=1 Tax=Hydra vulgaris TaxID=6087 RepID=UPI0032EA4F13